MILLWVVGGSIAALVVVYMVRPRATEITLSAARFFRDLPPARARESIFRISWPRPTPAFFLQLLLLSALFAAIWNAFATYTDREEVAHIGVWLWFDTSASMSTLQGGRPRVDLALEQVRAVLREAQQAMVDTEQEEEFCFALSAFDLERRDLVAAGRGAAELDAMTPDLTPRPLGTDLALVQAALGQASPQETPAVCAVTHVVVVSDQIAPDWAAGPPAESGASSGAESGDEATQEVAELAAAADLPIFWIDVGEAQPNVGFAGVEATRDPFTGAVSRARIELAAYVRPPTDARLLMVEPGETQPDLAQAAALDWRATSSPDRWRAQVEIEPERSGRYRFLLLVPDFTQNTYAWDDILYIDTEQGDQIRVDWRLPAADLPERLGWRLDAADPQLRVATRPAGEELSADEVPLLLVGPGYAPTEDSPQPIGYLFEASPLLADLNLDVAEISGIAGIEAPPAGFAPVLRDAGDRVWLAQRAQPPAAYIPGLPTGQDDAAGRLSAIAFFNAVRWLLQKRTPPPLYRLTAPETLPPEFSTLSTGDLSLSPDALEALGDWVMLHPGEGDTTHPPHLDSGPREWRPAPNRAQENPTWPYWLVAAALLFLGERNLTAWGDARWR